MAAGLFYFKKSIFTKFSKMGLNELKMNYLTMFAKYDHKIWLQMVWNKD